MHGILFWGTKNMILAKHAKNGKEAGLSPFVFGKAQRFSKNYTDEELRHTSAHLMEIYHRARRGIMPFDIGFETFLLALE